MTPDAKLRYLERSWRANLQDEEAYLGYFQAWSRLSSRLRFDGLYRNEDPARGEECSLSWLRFHPDGWVTGQDSSNLARPEDVAPWLTKPHPPHRVSPTGASTFEFDDPNDSGGCWPGSARAIVLDGELRVQHGSDSDGVTVDYTFHPVTQKGFSAEISDLPTPEDEAYRQYEAEFRADHADHFKDLEPPKKLTRRERRAQERERAAWKRKSQNLMVIVCVLLAFVVVLVLLSVTS